MTINLGSTPNVYRILNSTTQNIAEADVIARLQEADRKIRARHFNHYMEDQLFATSQGRNGTIRRSYELYFPVKQGTTPKVFILGQELTASDYTITDNYLTISSTAVLNYGDQIVVHYTPDFFDDYANYMAAMRIIDSGMIDAGSSVATIQIRDNVKQNLTEYERLLAKKPFVGRFRDHNDSFGNGIN